MYSNVDQLLNKIEELRFIATVDQPDIIFLTEVIPKAQKNPIHESLMNISGYDKYLNFNLEDSNLGSSGKRGVAIYIKESLSSTKIVLGTKYADQIWIEVKLRNNDKLLCGCVYRSPSQQTTKETTTKVCEIIQEAYSKNKDRLIICGDFNYPDIDWENEFVTNESIKPFIESVQNCHLFQHVCKPTRYRDGQEPSLLDLILTNEEGLIHDLHHRPGLADSDHEILTFAINGYKENISSASSPNYFKSDYITMRKRLNKINWSSKLSGGFSDSFQEFINEMNEVTKGCITQKLNRKRKKNLYMNKKALHLKEQKERLWKKYKRTKAYYDRERYRSVKNRLRSFTRLLRRDFEGQLAREAKTEPKRFWAYVKSKTKTRCKIPPLLKSDGTLATIDKEKAEVLNNFFSSVFTVENV